MIKFERNKVIRLNAQYGKRFSERGDEYVPADHAVVDASVRQAHLPFARTRSDTKELRRTLPVVMTDRDNLNPNQILPFGIHPWSATRAAAFRRARISSTRPMGTSAPTLQ